MGKIVTKEAYQKIKKDAKKSGRKVVLCHGVFDLVHPGHIIHFEEAKKMLTYPNERRILKKAHEWITNEECKNHNENRKGRRPYKGSRRGA